MASTATFASYLLFSVAAAIATAALASAGNEFSELAATNKTHLHFYLHDIVSGSNPTVIKVAKGPFTSNGLFGFGDVVVVDDPLTEGPNLTSMPIGRAQGMYAFASADAELRKTALLFTFNVVFTEGEYKGSSLAVVGRDAIFDEVRELPVVGGDRLFPAGSWVCALQNLQLRSSHRQRSIRC
ncbi:Disease resistance response protein 206 [Apostasia shenzhenica]|uniref:Dirigent protein n=1 Tax=Apostasia shenzhenica TaxID=1088818 RepID=A0A2I0APQ8_9ASPA|nr:Disease resistance response protein 206 [Apostasia shenzhenica]